MTFAHPLVGLILGKELGYTSAYVLGSIFPDIDHLFVLIRHRHFNPFKAYRAMKDERFYGERYKTPYTHSFLAWVIFSLTWMAIDISSGMAFCIGYFSHLVLDAIDRDEKQYFYPFKFKFKGFLPIFSIMEVIVGLALIGIYFVV